MQALESPENLGARIDRILAERKARQSALRNLDIVDYGEAEYYIVNEETREAALIKFALHQKAVLRYSLLRNDAGNRRFTVIIYSSSKKSGKTTLGGVVGRYVAETQSREGEVYCLGNDLEQAKERSFASIGDSVRLTPGAAQKAGDWTLPNRWQNQKTKMYCLTSGTTIKAISVDARGEAGSNPDLTIWCVAEDTEALTRDGFKLVKDLTSDDELATLNPQTHALEWQRPRAVNVKPYKGKMVRFKHRRVEFLVTPNHRVYGRFFTHRRYREKPRGERDGWRFESAETAHAFSQGEVATIAKSYSGESECPPLFAKLLGYYVAEGHCAKSYVILSQNPGPVRDEMLATAQALGMEAKAIPQGVRIYDKDLQALVAPLGKSVDKYVPRFVKDAPRESLQAFFDAYIDGDGHRGKDGKTRPVAWTISTKLVDDLCEIGLKLGYHPRVCNLKKNTNPRARPCHMVSFSRTPVIYERPYGEDRPHHFSVEDYAGVVSCPSVPNGIFYIRYRGKCCWTGNTELWGFQYPDAVKFFVEMTPPPTKPDSIRLIETYAGFEGESALLESYYKTGLRGHQLTVGELARAVARDVDGERYEDFLFAFEETQGNPDALVPIWVNASASMFMYWDSGWESHRMPWQRGPLGDAYYREEEHNLPANEFIRLHLNQWTGAESQFVPMFAWDACLDESIPTIEGDASTPLILSADAATTGDCFGIVAVSRAPMQDSEHETEIWVRAVQKWDPKEEGGVLDYSGPEAFLRTACLGGCVMGHPLTPQRDSIDLRFSPKDAADEFICDACRAGSMVPRHNVVQIAYDPYQLHDMMTRLVKEGVVWCEAFNQGKDRLSADRQLYDLIIQRRLKHPGIPALREHVQNANVKLQKDEDSKMRIVKKASAGKIDLVVALSMGTSRCLYLRL